HLPHALLEVGATGRQLEVEGLEPAGEVALELAPGLLENRWYLAPAGAFAHTFAGGRPAHARQGVALGLEGQPADRALHVTNRHAASVASGPFICQHGRRRHEEGLGDQVAGERTDTTRAARRRRLAV